MYVEDIDSLFSLSGLTAAVVKDAKGEFYLEGGAMVLADGGIICIDEVGKFIQHNAIVIVAYYRCLCLSLTK